MIIAFKTTDMNNFLEWNEKVQEKIKGHQIGIIFNKVDFDFFEIKETDKEGNPVYLVLMEVSFILPNIIPRKFFTDRIKKSLARKGGVIAEMIKPKEALCLLIEHNCGERIK